MSHHKAADIERTFMELCETMPFEKIRVSDICARADIAKQTFYNHFRDKYDVAAHILVEDFNVENMAHGNYTYARYEETMQSLWNKRTYYRSVLKADGQNSLRHYARDYTIKETEKQVTSVRGVPLTEEQRFYLLYHANAWVSGILEWLDGNWDFSPDKMTEMFYSVIPSFITSAWK